MGLADRIFPLIRGNKSVPITFFIFRGNCETPAFMIDLDSLSGSRTAYGKCSPVFTVVNRLASAMANGKWWIVDDRKDSEDVSNKYKNIYNLIKAPNCFQTLTDFIKQVDTYRSLYEVAYVYAVVPSGFKVADAVSMWAINPECVETVYRKGESLFNSTKVSDVIEKYIIRTDNSTFDNVNPEHVLCIRDSSATDFRKKAYSPRIESLQYEIKNIVQAQEAIYALNRDRGAMGIITNKTKDATGSIPLLPEEKKEIQKEYERVYGLSEKQSKVMLTNSDLGWIPMTFNVRDLMLNEGLKQNIERIADAFGYPYVLLANSTGTTFANMDAAIKSLYQETVIPAAKVYAEKFTRFFGLEGARIDIDFSDVEYLQEAKSEKADYVYKTTQAAKIQYESGVITREEFREALDMDEKPKGTTFYSQNTNSNGNEG